MLYRMDKLIGMSIAASDGEIGKVSDVYFDDHFWAARYLVVKTGGYFDDRQVLISPRVVTGIDWDQRILHVGLTRQKVKAAPPSTRTSRLRGSMRLSWPVTTAIPAIGAVPFCGASRSIR